MDGPMVKHNYYLLVNQGQQEVKVVFVNSSICKASHDPKKLQCV